MPYQLYYNTQTMTKNIVFCIRKQQVLDPREKFFIGDSGDDRLELHFGRTRMIGGHNSGCSYAQVLDRLGAAKDIDGVFKRHPELDPGHRRLKMGTQHENVDHINREMWRGDIVSGHCDLPSAWQMGRDMALSNLTRLQIDLINYLFATLFSDPGIDMLRPFGLNKYLGISVDDTEDVSISAPPISSTPQVITSHPALTDVELMHADSDNESDEPMLTFEEALTTQSDINLPPPQSVPIPSDPSAPPIPEGPGIRADNYLLFKGRWIHKQTVCRLVINKDFVSKSCNRLERVRAGYTKVNKRINMSAGRITDGNLFLIHSGRTVSVGVLRSTLISSNNISCSSINIMVMKAARTTVKITGQLLTIIPTRPPSDSPLTLTQFLWTGGYVKSRSVIPGTSDSTDRVVIITVPSSLVEPINPKPTFIQLCEDINTDDFAEIKGGQSTWQIAQDALQAACDLLWEKSLKTKVNLKSLTSVTPSDVNTFPYRLLNSMFCIPTYSFFINDLSQAPQLFSQLREPTS
jgi:hypothetical protein